MAGAWLDAISSSITGPVAALRSRFAALFKPVVPVLEELFPAGTNEAMVQVQEHGWGVDAPGGYCGRCGASAGPYSIAPGGCPLCIDRPLPWQRFVRLGAYEMPVTNWIRAMKFAGQWSWAEWFGQLLAEVVPEPSPGLEVVVCPVPMPRRRRWRRGFNQAQLMAGALAARRGWPVLDLLHRRRHRRPQAGLSPTERLANARGSFAVKSIDLSGWEVWLVDDLKTTGATLGACARLLQRAGADYVSVAVAAVADLKR